VGEELAFAVDVAADVVSDLDPKPHDFHLLDKGEDSEPELEVECVGEDGDVGEVDFAEGTFETSLMAFARLSAASRASIFRKSGLSDG
jgi:hypothetical protein